jgi:hypothetical protein
MRESGGYCGLERWFVHVLRSAPGTSAPLDVKPLNGKVTPWRGTGEPGMACPRSTPVGGGPFPAANCPMARQNLSRARKKVQKANFLALRPWTEPAVPTVWQQSKRPVLVALRRPATWPGSPHTPPTGCPTLRPGSPHAPPPARVDPPERPGPAQIRRMAAVIRSPARTSARTAIRPRRPPKPAKPSRRTCPPGLPRRAGTRVPGVRLPPLPPKPGHPACAARGV